MVIITIHFYLYPMPRQILAYLAGILFICSLALPAFNAEATGVIGLGAVIYGWVALGSPIGCSYLANPLFIITFFLFFNENGLKMKI